MQISVGEAATLLDVDRTTVWRYMTREDDPLPAQKIGHTHVLWRSDVIAYMPKAKRARGPKPKPPGPRPS